METLKDWYVDTYYDMTPNLPTMTGHWIIESGLYEAMKKIALERIEEVPEEAEATEAESTEAVDLPVIPAQLPVLNPAAET